MKVVVIGGTGLIGSKVVGRLEEHGHQVVVAAPSTGVDTLTGEGLAAALKDASVVVDVSNSPSFEDAAVMEFFRTSTTNLLQAEREAGVGHHVALSVVGTDRLQGSGYFRAKLAQEELIKASGVPYTIVHATQFFEFAKGLADGVTDGDTVRLPAGKIQPIVSDDVAAAVARAAAGSPVGGVVEVAGPEVFELEEFIRVGLTAVDDPRKIVTAPEATYWGAELQGSTLLPGPDAHIAETRFADWLARQ
ncbi:NmrA family transcriptional regulator [Streptomyces sp. Act143]|uniref:SDR family oxidoreductase n=1 Tax=Streptomyces sp. Act143 TaxID=2200760 RepID=UPI000D67516D|nr:SDR family oxidoreductase [Streptomyces sp. Act143]PWI14792.1 NmrA family transcriptional regulator [Streptomyces sp. Act143]